ncbi:MAG: hypothetical protein J0L76_09555 [Rhodobacterales bacterium]|nr:hypothetical protein [Rhodobacterales bacterium]
MANFALCANSHSVEIRSANLDRSPCAGLWTYRVEEAAVSASIGYNRAIDATSEPVLVFAHHDVFLPAGWDLLLQARIAEVEAKDPDWAVIGAYGVAADGLGWGPVWSSSLGGFSGLVPLSPMPVRSLDEMLIVVRRASGVRFDDALPGWHLYGTDITLTAIAMGKGVYAGALPCIHNDGLHIELGPDFDQCYEYMCRKWRAVLPVGTPVTKLTSSRLHRMKQRYKLRKGSEFMKKVAVSTDRDPEFLAALCGWSDLSTSARWLADHAGSPAGVKS